MPYRRRSALHHLLSVPRQIWRHPNNRGRRLRRLAAAVLYQLRKRLGAAPATVALGDGLRVAAGRGAGGVSNLVYFGRYFEYDELHFCERYLRPGDHVVDGGAHIGLVSLLASRWVGREGSVLAFEPATRAAAQLRDNLERNAISNVRLIEAALGSAPARMSLIADMDVSNRLTRRRPADHRLETVRVVRLADVAGDRGFALAKLDLEGAELEALRGAAPLLAEGRLAVILLEALEHQLRRLGGSRREIFELLEAHRYRTAVYDAAARRLDYRSRPERGSFLALHPRAESTVRRRLQGD